MLHGNWSKSNIFLVLNRVWSFTTQSCCFGVYIIRITTRSCCFGIPDIFFQQRAPWSRGWHGDSSNGTCQWTCPSTRIHSLWCFSTVCNIDFSSNILADHPRDKFFSELPFFYKSFLLPNQQFTTQYNETWPASAHFTGEQNTIDPRGIVKRFTS